MSAVLVRLDIKASNNSSFHKVFWRMANSEAEATAWVKEVEFEHIELISEASIAKDGDRFSESRRFPVDQFGQLRVAELGQMTLADLMGVFSQIAFAQQYAGVQAADEHSSTDCIEAPAKVKSIKKVDAKRSQKVRG